MVAAPGHPQPDSKCLPASSKLIDNLSLPCFSHSTHSFGAVPEPASKTHTQSISPSQEEPLNLRSLPRPPAAADSHRQTVLFHLFPLHTQCYNKRERERASKAGLVWQQSIFTHKYRGRRRRSSREEPLFHHFRRRRRRRRCRGQWQQHQMTMTHRWMAPVAIS